MGESTKKRTNYNEDILSVLTEKYGYSIDYIRKSLRGDRTGIMPDQLVKEYRRLQAESRKAIRRAAKDIR